MLSKLKRFSYFWKINILLVFALGAFTGNAQNTPTLSITQPSGTGTDVDLPPATFPGAPSFVRTIVPKVPMVNEPLSSTIPEHAQMSVEFKDGFNRTMQSVKENFVRSGGTAYHLVQPLDTRFLVNPYSFLPYATNQSPGYNSNMFTVQRNYYFSKFPTELKTAASRNIVVPNGNMRAVKSMGPGKSQVGQNRGVTTKQTTNAVDEVKKWGIKETGEPEVSEYYEEGSLFAEQVYDTTGSEVTTFKDKDGNVVCRKVFLGMAGRNPSYAFTYYIYDDAGRLCWVLPPKAVSLSLSSISSTVKDNLCYQYKYDEKGRMAERKLPGKAIEEFVYDKWDRQVFYRDGSLLAKGQWSFTLYDPQDRPTVFGLANDNISRQDLANHILSTNPFTPNDILFYVKRYDLWNIYPQSFAAGTTILGYTYYDDYTHADPGDLFWNTYSANLQFTETQNSVGSEIPVKSKRTKGLITGTKVRILPAAGADTAKTGSWRQTANYYDDKGRLIYTYSEDTHNNTIKHAQYAGTQYNFSGKVLASKHVSYNANSADGMTTRVEMTNNFYDSWTGALTDVYHKTGNSAWVKLTAYAYDDLGRVKRKVLGNYGEVQDMDYNIRGQLTGINGVYAETGNKQGESRSFGQLLRYDYGFTQPKYDGKIAGMAWRGSSSGSSGAMAYGYTYDTLGRLKQADFRLRDAGVWGNNNMDYSVSNLSYDLNGNIRTMIQKATRPGFGIFTMDNLTYTYEGTSSQASNRLQGVVDATGSATATYGLGDFQDVNTTATDFIYDADGNVVQDLNKGITSVTYELGDKPAIITFSNGSKIINSYDATGQKVQQKIVDIGTGITKTTDYVGNYVYENDTATFVTTGEGRSTFINHTEETKEEFFVKDYLDNVRSVIDVYTYPIQQYLASYEIASAGIEGLFFAHHNEIRDNNPSSIDPLNLQSGRLNGGEPDRRIGTAMLLKVMAGDKVEMNVNTFYYGYNPAADTPLDANTMLSTIVGTLTEGIGGFPGSESHNPNLVADVFNTANYVNIYQGLKSSVTNPNLPRAYLNYILFDEDMKIVSEMSGAYQATGNSTWATIGTTSALEIPKNGFMAVYLSNESKSIACANCSDVYFDQLTVRFTQGKLKEEAHYYPHGLPITGLGSAANGFKGNKRKYQDNEFIKDLGLNWMDFNARQYDPQLGRFLSVDPQAEKMMSASTYAAMNNNPVSLVDPQGTSAWGSDFTAKLAELFGIHTYSIDLAGLITFNNVELAKENFQRAVKDAEMGASGGMSLSVRTAALGILAFHDNPYVNVNVSLGNNFDFETTWAITMPETEIGSDGSSATLWGDGTKIKMKSHTFTGSGGIMAAKWSLNATQLMLDALGSSEIPGISQVGDLGSAGVSIFRGDWTGAGLSLGGAIVPGMSQYKMARTLARMTKSSYTVYRGIDITTNTVKYVGITKRNPLVRFNEHLRSNTAKSFLDFRVVPGATGLTKMEARVMEQTLINQHGLNNLLNKVNSISPKYWDKLGIK
jgi:RHS repeat-associated protein